MRDHRDPYVSPLNDDPELDVSPWPARVGLVVYVASMVAFVTIMLGWWRP